MNAKVRSIAFHRNGVGGLPFSVVLFDDEECGRMVGIVFGEPMTTAVLNIDLLSDSNIAFGENSWRGDRWDEFLRSAIAEREAALTKDAIDRFGEHGDKTKGA